MNARTKQIAAITLAVVFVVSAFIGGYGLSQGSAQSTDGTVTVQDSAGRYVELEAPVESIVVLWSNPVEEIRALGAIDRIVGIDQSTQEKVDIGLYPELADVQLVGTWDNPNYEVIAELDPDVVIMLSSYAPLPSEVQAQLNPFDIPVVGLDFYMVEAYFQELRTLGFMLGLEERAEEYIEFFDSMYGMIEERVSDITWENRTTVYFESADDAYSTYGGGDYGCGIPGIIRAAGGMDLYPEATPYWFMVDPESVIVRNPDVIIKGDPKGYLLNDTSEFETIYEEIMNRPELQSTNAVLEERVYVLSFDVAGGARKKFGPVFLAKILYPELFEDLDPEVFLQEYLNEWQGLEYRGVYLYPGFA
jgi:iron complex transport system substrate-binding protein